MRLSGVWLGDLDGIFMVSTSGRHDGDGTVYIPQWGMWQVCGRCSCVTARGDGPGQGSKIP